MISCMINFSIAGFWYRDSAEAAFASALAMKGQPVELPLQSNFMISSLKLPLSLVFSSGLFGVFALTAFFAPSSVDGRRGL